LHCPDTGDGEEIGSLSKAANADLIKRQMHPERFQFQAGEILVKHVYRHKKVDEVTGETLEDWFVIIPQIRVCR
jgi:ATP-dependent DNA helicase RecQ